MARLVVLVALHGACGFSIATTPPTEDGPREGGGGSGDAAVIDAVIDAPTRDGAPTDAMITCPPGFTPRAPMSCHRQGATAATWPAAEADCETDGAHLVVVDDSAENAALPANVWIGYSEVVTPGTFRWVTGVPTTFMGWAAMEPGSVGGASCVEARPDGWHDDNGPELKAYVCEYDGRAADPAQF